MKEMHALYTLSELSSKYECVARELADSVDKELAWIRVRTSRIQVKPGMVVHICAPMTLTVKWETWAKCPGPHRCKLQNRHLF